MASIILSFVGSQDPHSKYDDEGSIVSLFKHLCEQQRSLKHMLLLYTDGTQQNAIDTKDWLLSETADLTTEMITLMAVGSEFSQDPINQLLAVQEARRAIEVAQGYQAEQDTLEFNGSSGTPAMKSCWSILQATGYAPHSHVWQIRNPKEMQSGQSRVFINDVNVLKNEFDSQVIQRQIRDYNYSGALVTLETSNLEIAALSALLNYGFYRISLDFDRAFNCIDRVKSDIDPQWIKELAPLRQNDRLALLAEAYFNALTRLKNKRYAEFLVSLFGLQENILKHLIQQQLNLPLLGTRFDIVGSWQVIRQTDQGKLYRYLQEYTLPKGDLLEIDQSISRYVMIAILEYFPQFSQMIPLIKFLNDYCEQRNRSVHEFAGISEIQDEERVLTTLRKIMKSLIRLPEVNPFDVLNQQLCGLLVRSLSE
jgi:hypothetical protein